jgi:hypothetical protein
MNIDRIYIAHLKKLVDRGIYIKQLLASHPFFIDRTTVFAVDEQDDEILFANNCYVHTYYPTLLNRQEICFTQQMMHIFLDISKSNFENCLVMEDDFRLTECFDSEHQRVFGSIPSDSACTYVGAGNTYELLVPAEYPDEFFPAHSGRWGTAYVISRETCRKIVDYGRFHAPLDHHLNFIQNHFQLKYYWTKTVLFLQGSMTNHYKSNIR